MTEVSDEETRKIQCLHCSSLYINSVSVKNDNITDICNGNSALDQSILTEQSVKGQSIALIGSVHSV